MGVDVHMGEDMCGCTCMCGMTTCIGRVGGSFMCGHCISMVFHPPPFVYPIRCFGRLRITDPYLLHSFYRRPPGGRNLARLPAVPHSAPVPRYGVPSYR